MKLKRKEKKGENGKVLIIGGSEDYPGAVCLAAIAAYRSGVDIVTVAAPEKVAWVLNAYRPDIITKKLMGKELDLTHVKQLIQLSEEFDSVLVGCGLGIKKEFVLKLCRSISKPKVIDADAIKVLNLTLIKKAIFTPHAKEFEILLQNSLIKPPVKAKQQEQIKALQKELGDNIILLKGKEDIIFSKTKIEKNKTGHNSMTIGGTGDILAGLCAGLLAQTKDLFGSAKRAAYLNGKAGEYLFKQKGYGYLASEMANELWRFTK